MRVAFLGTSTFACPALEAVARAHEVALVVTQPDRRAGRQGELKPPPIKALAENLGIPIAQPAKINTEDAIAQLAESSPDVTVVAAYGQILRPKVFEIPPMGTINIHASILPAYRGAAPVRWAIVRGETVTGVTTFFIDAGMDTGDMLLKRELEIGPDETAGELENRLAELGAETILETLSGLSAGTLKATPQPDEGITYAPILTRDDGRVDWSKSAREVHNHVRGMAPWPGAWTELSGKRVKLLRSARTEVAAGRIEPGALAAPESGRLLIGCADELLEILDIQREGRPRTDGRSFLNGLQRDARFGW